MQYICYSLFFYFIIFALLKAQVKEEKIGHKTKKKSIAPFLIIAIFTLVRIGFASSNSGHPYDIKCFTLWAEHLAQVGPWGFYAPGYFADYPPGYMVVLSFLGLIGKLFQMPAQSGAFSLLIRMPSILADGALGFMLYSIAKEKIGEKNASVFLFLFLLNPVLILNSAIWGQIDAFFTLFLFASLYLLYKEKYITSAVFYSICTLIKPQSLIFGPVFLCVFLTRKDWRILLKAVGASILTFVIVTVPFFGIHFEKLIQKYMETLNSYNFATVNAYNIYALFGMNWAPTEGIFWTVFQMAILGVITLFSIWFYIEAKDKDKIFYMAYLLITTVFTIAPKMHERYIFPALILIFVCYFYRKDKRLLWLFYGQTIAQLINTGLILISSLAGNDNYEVPKLLIGFSSLLNIAIFIYSIYCSIRIYMPQYEASKNHVKISKMPLPSLMETGITKKDIIFMLCVVLLYGVIAYNNLGDKQAPQTFYWSNGHEVILDLNNVKPINKLMLYEGIGNGEAKIKFSYSDNGSTWKPLMVGVDGSTTDQDSFHPSFVWEYYQTDAEARYIKLNISMSKQMFGEIGIFSPEGEQYNISAPNGEKELIDEQNVVPDSPSYKNGTYFDEIYHARTAYEMIHGLPIYETTHPPLGKIIISWGIMLFGMTPFGWRIMGTFFGIFMLPVLYMMIKKMFGRSRLALGGTILFAVDFMHFSLTRISTIDSFVTFFIMLSYLFMLYYFTSDFYKQPIRKSLLQLGLCGLFFGLSVSTKWIGLYAAGGLALLLAIYWIKAYIKYKMDQSGEYQNFVGRFFKTIAFCVLSFVIVPGLLYYCAYAPQMRYDKPEGKNAISYIWDCQTTMFRYHSKDVVNATHPYSSKWDSWLVDGRPLWAYTNSNLSEGMGSTITIMGNPFIWWAGFISLLSLLCWFSWRDRRAIFLLIAYLAQLLPWVFVERTTFIYHYFSCVPFMIISLCYIFAFIEENYTMTSKYIKYYYLLAILLFILFYPALSGFVVPKAYITWLRWFPRWVF